ncbi:MFS transporter [Kribbella sp. NBC_00382]|uniref:MFS transporter n=1 Tax=Kribbella sp. NBC_00382 TaxID=2975967 RepID=UPI002E24001E
MPRSLSARIVAFEALQDFIPLYPVYQLLFTDHGLSATEVSSLFIIWSTTAFLLEVPSGAWADVFSRRKLLVLGTLVRGLGFAGWIVVPSYAGFALGFVLWGISSALISGTFEALVYDELAARGAADRYAGLIGRAKSAALVLNLAATALAAPLFKLGGYPLLGAVSVLSCLAQAAVALSLPEATPVATADETKEMEAETDSLAGEELPGAHLAGASPMGGSSPGDSVFARYVVMLRAGLSEVTTSRVVRKAVVLVALLGGFLAFDEYFPLLARGIGASTALVPLLIAGTVAAQAIGGALAGPAYRMRGWLLGVGLALSAGMLAWGALSGTASGFVPIAIGYGVMQLVIIVAEARLQDAITGPARATVTSVSGLFAEVFAVMVYAGFALGAVRFALPVLVAGLTIPLFVTALITPAALPPPASQHEEG